MGVYTLQETIFRNARRAGLTQIGEISIADLKHEEWVRTLCEENLCQNYGASWACPPAVGTLEDCGAFCRTFDRMFLFNRVFPLRDSYDLAGMDEAAHRFGQSVDRFDELVGSLFRYHLFLAYGGCTVCEQCTFPDAPCRYPRRLHPAIEGFGLNVMRLADLAGLSYNNGYKTLTMFGALLYCE